MHGINLEISCNKSQVFICNFGMCGIEKETENNYKGTNFDGSQFLAEFTPLMEDSFDKICNK